MNLTKSELRKIDDYNCIYEPNCYINFGEINVTSDDADV